MSKAFVTINGMPITVIRDFVVRESERPVLVGPRPGGMTLSGSFVLSHPWIARFRRALKRALAMQTGNRYWQRRARWQHERENRRRRNGRLYPWEMHEARGAILRAFERAAMEKRARKLFDGLGTEGVVPVWSTDP